MSESVGERYAKQLAVGMEPHETYVGDLSDGAEPHDIALAADKEVTSLRTLLAVALERQTQLVEALMTYPGIYDDGELYAWEKKLMELKAALLRSRGEARTP